MIHTLFLDRDTFAARRRKAQDAAVEALRDHVAAAALAGEITDDLLAAMQNVYETAYHEDITDGDPGPIPTGDLTKIQKMLDKTEKNLSPATLAIANLLINEAAVRAALDDEDDLFLEWVTMHDKAVRESHAVTDGQIRPAGEKFDVDGVEMSMPGDISAPLELWINCRCSLRPTFPPDGDFHVRETTFVSEKPWNGAASRFTPEQWKRSCIHHTCQGMEKSCHHLPIREPGGALSRAGVHAAASRINQTKGDTSAAKAALRGAYKQLGEEPPDAIKAAIQPTVNEMGHTGSWIIDYTPSTTTTSTFTVTSPNTGVITMTAPTTEKPETTEEDLAGFEGMDDEQISALETLVPWHGVLAPEGVASGDGRTFAPDSLSFRDLPLPLTYQKATQAGHDGSVVVGSIETIERVDGQMRASGWLLATEEADEVVGLIAHFGKYGVSVDADDAEFDYEDDNNAVTFTRARICSASLVSIPAFAEAYITLGPWEEDEALVASGEIFVKTEDGPGWLTHPVDTDRLRDYWVRGPGAAKIGWGVPGDFNRCRLQLAKYVKPQYLAGYCANRHYDALGFWPGRPVSAETIPFAEGTEQAPALTLVASAIEAIRAPADWFENPALTRPTHLTVTEEGRVFGHVAEWGVCHIGMSGVCIDPPRSMSNYACFANKHVLLDDGKFARTGVITIGGKHAPGAMGLRAASRHYDDTTMAVCDVSIGEDSHGIWVAGWVRPGTDEEAVVALRASDISGDWRQVDRTRGEMELVGVLAVNTGGFPVRVAATAGRMVSLVAAGMVEETAPVKTDEVDFMAEAIAKAFERVERNRATRAATMASLRTKRTEETD